jgi:hypothetical protein
MGILSNIQTLPSYEMVLPSNNRKIKYRPFIVAEEKILLMAMQESESQVILAIKNIIDACTYGELNVEKLPTVDIEMLFITLRNKSLGEGLSLEARCTHCNAKNYIECDFSNVKIERKAEVDKNITLSDTLKVVMKYPTLEMTYDLKEQNADDTILLIAKCVEFVDNKGKLIDCSELPIEEVKDFVEHLTQVQLRELNKFFDSIPKTVFEDTFVCKSCLKDNKVRVEGISSFFD